MNTNRDPAVLEAKSMRQQRQELLDARVKKLTEEGLTAKLISERLGVSTSTLEGAYRRLGIQRAGGR